MRIAVASMGDQVSPHFGRCENFQIYDIEDNTIIAEESLVSPGHDSGVVLPYLLAEQGVTLIISGGMGEGAQLKFQEKKIPVLIGAQGSSRSAVEAYLNGTLEVSNTLCSGHHHEE